MAQLLLHLGFASRGSVTALLLSRAESAPPTVSGRDLSTGRNLSVEVREHASLPLRELLAARGVKARRIEANGLSEVDGGAPFELLATTAGAQPAVVRSRAVPSRLPAGGLTVAAWSCFFHGFPAYRRLAEALRSRRLVERAALQLQMGDNLYLDIRDGGGFLEGTPESVVDRYLEHLLDPAIVETRAAIPALTTWDDHEYWNDYPESQPWLSFSHGDKRDPFVATAKDCVDAFAASLNPPGTARSYSFTLDGPSPPLPGLSVFVADARSERSRADAEGPTMMPDAAFVKLLAWARGLDRPGVLVIGQPLWIEGESKALGLFTGDHNPPFFRAQYRALMDALRDNAWETLILTGDVHYSRLAQLTLGGNSGGDRLVYELISSALVHLPAYGPTLLRSVFQRVGLPQVSSEISDPARIDYPAALRMIAGTSAANSFALARFTPVPGGVRVNVAFEDLTTLDRAASTNPQNAAPEGCAITLRRR